jgi:hypothetical protein
MLRSRTTVWALKFAKTVKRDSLARHNYYEHFDEDVDCTSGCIPDAKGVCEGVCFGNYETVVRIQKPSTSRTAIGAK